MRILVFSDIHSDLKALERLMETEADYYFAAGDLVSWERGLDKVGPILNRRAGRVYVIPGNHETATQITSFCANFGLIDFHCQTVQIAGYHFAGLGYSNHTPFHTPGEYTEQQLAERLAPFAGLQPLVLICHCPPKDTPLDGINPGAHFGSAVVAKFIRKNQPEWFFCGHIHEAEGIQTKIGKTQAINVGKRGYLLNLNE